MSSVFEWIDANAILTWVALALLLVICAAPTIHALYISSAAYRRRHLAGGVSSSSRDRQHAGVSSGAASPSDLASRPQDFDNDHPGRERLGLRRGK